MSGSKKQKGLHVAAHVTRANSLAPFSPQQAPYALAKVYSLMDLISLKC